MVILTKEMSGGFKDVSAKEGIVTGYLNAFSNIFGLLILNQDL
jgi:hypothetical protein